eukprot:6205380-Pleurochrysis_carterae.AAC.1
MHDSQYEHTRGEGGDPFFSNIKHQETWLPHLWPLAQLTGCRRAWREGLCDAIGMAAGAGVCGVEGLKRWDV